MPEEKNGTKLDKEDIAELAAFFDLLAKYDWEDKQKERAENASTEASVQEEKP